VFVSHAAFALSITFVFAQNRWVADGWPRILDHIFVVGSATALAACLAVPLGIRFSEKGTPFAVQRPVWAMAASALLWILGIFVV
jgi:ABC-type proline/glycine betaine transport system permease subunit